MVRSMLRYISRAAYSQSRAYIPRSKIRRIGRAAAAIRCHIDEHRLIGRAHRAIPQPYDECRKIEREIIVQLVEYQKSCRNEQHPGLDVAHDIALAHPLVGSHPRQYQPGSHHKEIDSRLGIYPQLLLAINGQIRRQSSACKSESNQSQTL